MLIPLENFRIVKLREKIIHVAKTHKDADRWDVQQQIMMTPEERQKIARELKKRFYGNFTMDVRGKKK